MVLAYLLNFLMMRIEEGWWLRSDCLEIERDERFGPIYLLRGPTMKTIEDSEADGSHRHPPKSL